MTPFCREVLEAYLREDMAELDNPLRKDSEIILQDLRFLYRQYGRTFKTERKVDWVKCENR